MGRRAGLQKLQDWTVSQYGEANKPAATERTLQTPQDIGFNAQGEVGKADDSGLAYKSMVGELEKYNQHQSMDDLAKNGAGFRYFDSPESSGLGYTGEDGRYVAPEGWNGAGYYGLGSRMYAMPGGQDMYDRRQATWDYFAANNPGMAEQNGQWRGEYMSGLGQGGAAVTDSFRNALGAQNYDDYMAGKKPVEFTTVQNTAPMEGANAQMSGAQMNMFNQQPQAFADGGMVGLGSGAAGAAPSQPMLALRYADGGMIPGQQPGMQAPGQPGQENGKVAEMQLNDLAQKDPQGMAQMRNAVMQLIQSGQLNPQELNTATQLAKAVIHNPQLWPQLRQFAIQQGLCGPNDLPQQYDPSVPRLILLVAKSIESTGGVQQPGMQQLGQMGQGATGMQPGQPAGGQYADGGMIVGPGTGRSDSIETVNQATGQPVKVSTGEYIIPAHVVEAKGKDFFDSMLRKYAPLTPGGGSGKA